MTTPDNPRTHNTEHDGLPAVLAELGLAPDAADRVIAFADDAPALSGAQQARIRTLFQPAAAPTAHNTRKALETPQPRGGPHAGNSHNARARNALRDTAGPPGAPPAVPGWDTCLLNKAITPEGHPARVPADWQCPHTPCCGMGPLLALLADPTPAVTQEIAFYRAPNSER